MLCSSNKWLEIQKGDPCDQTLVSRGRRDRGREGRGKKLGCYGCKTTPSHRTDFRREGEVSSGEHFEPCAVATGAKIMGKKQWWLDSVATGTRRKVDECPALPLGCRMLRSILPEMQPRKHPESHGKRLGRSSLPKAGSEGPLTLRRTSFALQQRLCQPPLSYSPPSHGACVLLFPEERPSFQQRVLESWGRTGI